MNNRITEGAVSATAEAPGQSRLAGLKKELKKVASDARGAVLSVAGMLGVVGALGTANSACGAAEGTCRTGIDCLGDAAATTTGAVDSGTGSTTADSGVAVADSGDDSGVSVTPVDGGVLDSGPLAPGFERCYFISVPSNFSTLGLAQSAAGVEYPFNPYNLFKNDGYVESLPADTKNLVGANLFGPGNSIHCVGDRSVSWVSINWFADDGVSPGVFKVKHPNLTAQNEQAYRVAFNDWRTCGQTTCADEFKVRNAPAKNVALGQKGFIKPLSSDFMFMEVK